MVPNGAVKAPAVLVTSSEFGVDTSRMHTYRDIPLLEDTPADYVSSGHFWIQEYILGRLCRFQMDEAGLLTVGDADRTFDPDGIPPHFRPAIETVRTDLDRDTLRAGTDQVEAYTFFGVAPLAAGVDYDWEEIPDFLGVDIWDGSTGEFVPEDVVERVFESVGLSVAPILEKEVPARQFSPGTFTFPDSRYADDPVPGVVLRKKNGDPSLLVRSDEYRTDPAETTADPLSVSLETWVADELTAPRLETLARSRELAVETADLDVLAPAIAGEIARRAFTELSETVVRQPGAFDAAVRERISTLRTKEWY